MSIYLGANKINPFQVNFSMLKKKLIFLIKKIDNATEIYYIFPNNSAVGSFCYDGSKRSTVLSLKEHV